MTDKFGYYLASPPDINSGFWIGDFGLRIPKFTRLPPIESVALFPRMDMSLSLATVLPIATGQAYLSADLSAV
ncbi:hypothetical protein [Thermoleptolyngbya sp.]